MTSDIFKTRPRPFAIIILDGWGVGKASEGNAVSMASTPYLDSLIGGNPNTLLDCSGLAVGLPEGQMGNSEVGHLNIGAGRVVYQDLTRISKAIDDGSFFDNPVLQEGMKKTISGGGALHLMGLVSDGGVHSSDDHYFALIDMASRQGVGQLYFHAFLDGRDVGPKSALSYLEPLENKLSSRGYQPIATVSGRYFAMDRDNRWERVDKAYQALVYRRGVESDSAIEAVTAAYSRGEDDEFVQPTISNTSVPGIKPEDTVIFFNFRSDRTRELTRTFIDKDLTEFDRGLSAPFPYFICMTEYDKTFDCPVAFAPQFINDTLADVISAQGMNQLHIAETEKYAHVTFFFNGGIEVPKKGEERILIPSPKVATYDLKPEMSAFAVAEATVDEIEKDHFDVIIMNFANCDMVGHTGVLKAAVSAVEVVDKAVGQVVDAIKKRGGECFILADHGNAEKMFEGDSGKPFTAHTANQTPFIYVTDKDIRLKPGGSLCDIAPTALQVLGIEQPTAMTGVTLIE